MLIVWGPSAKLLENDPDLQLKTKELIEIGVDVQACVTCADMYGVSDRLRELGITVKGMGVKLTELLQDEDWAVLSV